MITKLFPSQCNVYSKGPVGENVFHIAMLLNTPSTLAIAKYLVKLYGRTLVNTPYQVGRAGGQGRVTHPGGHRSGGLCKEREVREGEYWKRRRRSSGNHRG